LQADIPESTEIELQPTNEVPSSYQDLFSHVEQVSDSINKLEVTVNDMRRLHDEIIHNPLAHPPGGASPTDRLEAMMADVKLDASSVQARLKNMEKQIEEDQRGSGRHSTELRIRKAHHSNLSRKFMRVLEDYNKIQVEYREKCKERIARHMKITHSEKSPEEVETMLDEGNLGVFTQDIVIENERMRQALGDIEARHNDIMQLEKSMTELLEIFQTMSMLVYEQGELIENIEFNVMSAQEDVKEAGVQLKKARKLQSSARHVNATYTHLIVFVSCPIVPSFSSS
jgi:syntaxin 1A